MSFDDFVQLHKPQLISSHVPRHFWETLHRKLNENIFDAGTALHMLLDDHLPDEILFVLHVNRENGIQAYDHDAIFLIDHAWIFRPNTAREQLIADKTNLIERICEITGVDIADKDRINKVLSRMWKYSYSSPLNETSTHDTTPVWYIIDEVGSAVYHSDNPNFRLVPFLFHDTATTYSLLFPIRDCENGEQVTRDFVENLPKNSPDRVAMLLPWRNTDLRSKSFVQKEPPVEYFATEHTPDTYPTSEFWQTPQLNTRKQIRVYTESELVLEQLTLFRFKLVANIEDADVFWLTTEFSEFKEHARHNTNKFVNQFPFQYLLTTKDLLSIICRRNIKLKDHHNEETLETNPAWLPTTYNLKTELVQFASYFQHRAAKGLDNHWLIKPWYSAHGNDTHFTNDIKRILRMPISGPKVAQKYIDNPVLFYRADLEEQVKFDIRYFILLKTVQPIEAYVYQKFLLRFSNKRFSLDEFDGNYDEKPLDEALDCDEFLKRWQLQYPGHEWTSTVEDKVYRILSQVFVLATTNKPPAGMPTCEQSRALYAADIMLEWNKAKTEMQPKLLKIKWSPNCERVCFYDPDFFNDVFKLLFLNEKNPDSFQQIGVLVGNSLLHIIVVVVLIVFFATLFAVVYLVQ